MTAKAMLSPRPARVIDQSEIETFERDGVVCLRGMFDAGWTGMLHDAALEAMACGKGRVREPQLGEAQGRFYSSVYMSDIDERFRRLRDESPAPDIAATLMRADHVRFFYDQLFIKAPGTAAPTPWHNDLPFWPFQGQDLISLWIALTPVSRETSGVQYVAGSHRWNKMFRAITPDYDPRFMDARHEVCPDYAAAPAGQRVLSWDMSPGDVLCHHPLTVHGAAGNALRRRALACKCATSGKTFSGIRDRTRWRCGATPASRPAHFRPTTWPCHRSGAGSAACLPTRRRHDKPA